MRALRTSTPVAELVAHPFQLVRLYGREEVRFDSVYPPVLTDEQAIIRLQTRAA